MLTSLQLGQKFTRPVCRAAAAAVDRYLLQARTRPQQQTRRPPPLLSIDGTDGRTDTRPFYDAYRILRVNSPCACSMSRPVYVIYPRLISMYVAATAAGGDVGAADKCDGSLNNESAQLMMTSLHDRRAHADHATALGNNEPHHHRHHATALALNELDASYCEPTYADVMTTSSASTGAGHRRRSDHDLPVFPRHQLHVLAILGTRRAPARIVSVR